MASFNVALAWTLDNWEDPSHEYKKAPDAPPGAFAIAGINSAAWPEEFAAINATPQVDRAVPVAAFYFKHFWTNWLSALTSDEVAKRVLDMAVNTVEKTAVKLLQQALNTFHINGPLVADGWWGPLTIGIANGFDASSIVAAFQQLRVAHYKENDADSPLLPQLIARALD